jgi:BirA family biotin operon repressor/biotin-[acetyl-CoA-carboxylase] ligase
VEFTFSTCFGQTSAGLNSTAETAFVPFVPLVAYNLALMKPRVLRYESLPSTNTEVARLAADGAEEGLAIVADEQTAGRGRLQRAWSSTKGAGLYFSILLRPALAPDRWPLITFVAALATGDALLEANEVHTDIKWPNDLLANGRKICGILAEAIETPTGRAVVLGTGINLTNDAFPEDLSSVATSVANESQRTAEREAILSALLNALSRWYSLLHETDGAEKIVAAWSSRSSYATGKLVQVRNGEETLQGLTHGIENDGALRLETAQGIQLIRAGDVTNVRPAKANT